MYFHLKAAEEYVPLLHLHCFSSFINTVTRSTVDNGMIMIMFFVNPLQNFMKISCHSRAVACGHTE
jgi:hypothetical protein